MAYGRVMVSSSLVAAALPAFTRLLRRRLGEGVHTTEDSVRYLMFAALLDLGYDPNAVVIEAQHPNLDRARIDTVLLAGDSMPFEAIEFKYDRAGPGGYNQPRPQKAGAALADVRRLAMIELPRRWFIHLVDDEMAAYLSSDANGLSRIWRSTPGPPVSTSPEVPWCNPRRGRKYRGGA